MSQQNSPKLPERLEWYERVIHAWRRLFQGLTGLLIALFALISIIVAVCRYVVKPSTHPPHSTQKTEIEVLHQYLNDVNRCLLSMEENASDENQKIAIKNFLEYKQSAIDVFAFKKYSDLNEKLNKSEKQAFLAYFEDIKKDLNKNAAEFSIDLSQCK